LWLDRRLGTVPLFALLGVIVGAVAAFYGVYKMVVPFLGDGKAGPRKGQDGDQ